MLQSLERQRCSVDIQRIFRGYRSRKITGRLPNSYVAMRSARTKARQARRIAAQANEATVSRPQDPSRCHGIDVCAYSMEYDTVNRSSPAEEGFSCGRQIFYTEEEADPYDHCYGSENGDDNGYEYSGNYDDDVDGYYDDNEEYACDGDEMNTVPQDGESGSWDGHGDGTDTSPSACGVGRTMQATAVVLHERDVPYRIGAADVGGGLVGSDGALQRPDCSNQETCPIASLSHQQPLGFSDVLPQDSPHNERSEVAGATQAELRVHGGEVDGNDDVTYEDESDFEEYCSSRVTTAACCGTQGKGDHTPMSPLLSLGGGVALPMTGNTAVPEAVDASRDHRGNGIISYTDKGHSQPVLMDRDDSSEDAEYASDFDEYSSSRGETALTATVSDSLVSPMQPSQSKPSFASPRRRVY